MGILLLIAFAFIVCIIGLIIMLISSSNKKKRCILQVPGVVVNIRPEDYRVSPTDDYGTIVYRPIINYQYNGQTYTYYHTIAKTSYKNIPVGMKVSININPDNPSEATIKI